MTEPTEPTPMFGASPGDIAAFTETMGALVAHNRQFSIGRHIAQSIRQHHQTEKRVAELVEEEVISDRHAREIVSAEAPEAVPLSEEQEMARSILGIVNAPVLDATGLRIAPSRKSLTLSSQQPTQAPSPVYLQLADGGRYSGFLLATNPAELDDPFRAAVRLATNGMARRAGLALSRTVEPRPHVLEILVYRQGIIAGLEHIGLGETDAVMRLTELSR